MNSNFTPYLWSQSNVFNEILCLDWFQYNYLYLNQPYDFYRQNSSIVIDSCPNLQSEANIH